ncbi:phosphopantothenoylcysteine synthetase/decarboxylase [Bradyrhizobium sp. YR681]|uniref:flavoprotein n=1 Tax=Bradyrhizobium sp. YR681 TaxID=1144344 RepID=UPI0002711BBA|nr:flavoprotein [Bradyrhizobium sp. YR681]EJN13536.1 phosphopantothenoylcysteine synthetase/decarboxylase [Bradyrhizobium sp. YR681]
MTDLSPHARARLCKNLVLGITGAVAASWMPPRLQTLRALVADEVNVVMTRGALRFLTPLAVSAISGQPALTDEDMWNDKRVPHITLSRSADLVLVMPASARILASCARAACDDFLSTLICATPDSTPVVFVPSMNETMWRNRLVTSNVALLRDAGYHVIDPIEGIEVATGHEVYGGMIDMPTLYHTLAAILSQRREESFQDS